MKRKTSIRFHAGMNILYKALVYSLVVLAILPFLWILVEFLVRGISNINIELFYRSVSDPIKVLLAAESGESVLGGIANGLFGSIFIILVALLMAVPLGIGLGLYMFGRKKTSAFVSGIYSCCVMLRGIPSIIIGIIVYVWVVIPMGSFSALAGGIALAFMIFPEIAYSTYISFSLIPEPLKETAYSLTGDKLAVTIRIFFPLVSKKILAGILSATSRALGETAPLLFTALGASYINWDIIEPTSALPLLVWNFFEKPGLSDLLWGASFILLLLCLSLSLWAKKLQTSATIYKS